MQQITDRGRYFQRHEFECKCGCRRADMDAPMVSRLDMLRERCGFALYPNSAFRCANHNAAVSSTGRAGPHTTGHAIDLRVYGHRAHEIIRLATELGFTGIGVKQEGRHDKRFIHLDDLPNGPGCPRPWIWSY